ncbi:uncharacterized protein LOC131667468 [Phymastichus coffea]|uniref:uncharacterized protein LOC131667468 n=1 Tax=Phymastichus coffea TaxID=108790 RepID=UPI00273BA0A8|nr:uncharacterized protein LOC131667468 [Phymastichus coffea]
MEVAFKNASITDDEAKYCQSVAALTPCAIAKVEDVLANAPNQDLYDDLKVKLIERFTESDSARVRKLLEGEEMGDRTPSEFYRSMKTHATSSTTDEFILQVWTTRLPLQVQAVMVASSETELDKVLKLADTVHAVNPQQPKQQISEISDFAALVEQMRKLTAKIDAITSQQSRSRSRSRRGFEKRGRGMTPAPTPNNNSPDGYLCFYHKRFQERAEKCRGPCTWSGNDARRQ